MDSPDNVLAKLHNKNKTNPAQYNLVCPYCGIRSQLVNGTVIYPHRYDLRDKNFYYCKDCNAYCGCHGGTTKPLGTLANKELRTARRKAHEYFDALWINIRKTHIWYNRSQAYADLAEYMELPSRLVHIGQFDLDQCKKVLGFKLKENKVAEYYDRN